LKSFTAKIGDIAADLRSGFASGLDVTDGVVQFRMNNVDRAGYINWEKVRRVPHTAVRPDLLVEPGDLLFNATNSPELVGKSALFRGFSEPVTFSNHFIRLRVKEAVAHPGYVSRWLQREFERGRFASMCRAWVNQASITKAQLADLSIPLPSIDEQQRIVAILDKADILRQKRKRAIRLLDTLTQSIFLKMFGDPAVNPRGFPRSRFGEIGKLDRGVSRHRPRNDPILLGGPHPLIQTGDVANSNGYITKFSSTYSDFGLRQSRKWPAGTLCITIAANIANTGILTFDACFPDSVVGFTADEAGLTQYVRVWLSFLKENLERMAPASAQKNINLEILRDLPIACPPSEEIAEFGRRMAALNAMNEEHQRRLLADQNLFTSLQHYAFSGEL
jgi:type I restriction enzyme S subunit